MPADVWPTPRFGTPIPRPDACVRLFCFPHAGGSAAVFTSWARSVADRPIEIAAARLPGHDSAHGERPFTDLDRLVDGAADAIAQDAARPFALFGHSFGAILAFEVARTLRDRGGAQPVHLFVSGAFAPHLTATSPPLRFIEGDTAFLEAVAARYGGVPRIVLEQAELRASAVPALRADLTLTETYTYRAGPPLRCPIAAYAGASDPIVPPDRLALWREQTAAEFSWRLFDGHHFYLNRARDALLADIADRLLRLA
jgi:surfactin synthase thioesterase subunit